MEAPCDGDFSGTVMWCPQGTSSRLDAKPSAVKFEPWVDLIPKDNG